MVRLATTTDVFSAIAEPRRREIIELLGDGEPWSVGELVDRVRLAQPTVSKHLGVLRTVGVVSVSKAGQRRLYRLNAIPLKAVHDWVSAYERYWVHQIGRIKARAEAKQATRDADRKRPPGRAHPSS